MRTIIYARRWLPVVPDRGIFATISWSAANDGCSVPRARRLRLRVLRHLQNDHP